MDDLATRIRTAMKKEKGLRLTPAEVHVVSRRLGISQPTATQTRQRAVVKKSNSPIRVHIRWLIRRDMPEVMEIDASCSDRWSEDTFIKYLRQRNVIGMVAELDERVVGFMMYELHKHRLNVIRFATSGNHRFRSIGRQMIEKIKGKLSPKRRNKITITVPEDNLDGLLFLKANGFVAVGMSPVRGDCDDIRMSYGIERNVQTS